MKSKKISKYLLISISSIFLFISCVDYLEKTPEAEVTDEDVFSTYESFQGFVDGIYPHVKSSLGWWYAMTMNWGGECWHTHYSTTYVLRGDYYYMLNFSPSILGNGVKRSGSEWSGDISGRGIWTGGWYCIRRSNLALEKLPLLVEATDEEKRLIEGQALFFRAYFFGEILRIWGGMPYLTKVLKPDDEMLYERPTYHECVDSIVKDLDKAIALLPEDWDDTGVGQESPGANVGRVTKGMALGYKQRHLLYAASPLMNGASGNSYTYDVEYAEKSAAAGWQLIQLANKGVYGLVPFEHYSDNYYKRDGTHVWTTETILARSRTYSTGNSLYSSILSDCYIPIHLSDRKPTNMSGNQAFVDRFEMADGTRYKVEYDQDDNKRWKNRDPRFYKNFYVDRDKIGDHPDSFVSLWIGPEEIARPLNQVPLAYHIAKYWPYNVNRFDRKTSNLKILVPQMRLAEAYLSYAEAVTVAYGPNGTAPGANISAVDAINIVRARANMPPVTSEASGYDNFLDLIQNERAVELAYEDQYWFDIRRWYIAHLDEHKDFVNLEFDKDWTYFTRSIYDKRVFEKKHYWFPIPKDQGFLYEGMYQNPGW